MRWFILSALALGFAAGCEYEPPERQPYGQTDAFHLGESPFQNEGEDETEGARPQAPEQAPRR